MNHKIYIPFQFIYPKVSVHCEHYFSNFFNLQKKKKKKKKKKFYKIFKNQNSVSKEKEPKSLQKKYSLGTSLTYPSFAATFQQQSAKSSFGIPLATSFHPWFFSLLFFNGDFSFGKKNTSYRESNLDLDSGWGLRDLDVLPKKKPDTRYEESTQWM